MGNVLLGYEFGANWGHVATLLPLAEELARRGHRALIGARDVTALEPVLPRLRARGIEILAAPLLNPIIKPPFPQAHTAADVFIRFGIAEPSRLEGVARAWRDVMRWFKPDLVVADWAPLLALAARGVCPVVTVGSGYTVPPSGGPLPPFRPWQSEVPRSSEVNEANLLASIHTVQQAVGLGAPLAHLSDLWGEPAFACVLPELDACAARRATHACGPLNILSPRAAGAATLPGESPFVYVGKDYALLAPLLAALAACPRAEVHVRGLDPMRASSLARAGIVIHTEPPQIEDVLGRASAVVHHGGINVSMEALQIGVPQFLLPEHPEQELNARMLEIIDVAMSAPMHGDYITSRGRQDVDLSEKAAQMTAAFDRFARNGRICSAASAKATEIAARATRPALEVVTEACQRALGSELAPRIRPTLPTSPPPPR